MGHDSIAVQSPREILIIGSRQNVYWTSMQSGISKCITNCDRIIYSAISNAASAEVLRGIARRSVWRVFVIARHRREGGGSYRVSYMTPALLKPPPPIRRPPSSSFTPKMAAHFLEAVRNRRVNIGRSISVFGRVERDGGMPWVIQASCNGTRNHKNLMQHTLTPTSARPLFFTVHSPTIIFVYHTYVRAFV